MPRTHEDPKEYEALYSLVGDIRTKEDLLALEALKEELDKEREGISDHLEDVATHSGPNHPSEAHAHEVGGVVMSAGELKSGVEKGHDMRGQYNGGAHTHN